MTHRRTANEIRAQKGKIPIVAVTATDHPSGRWADEAGVDIVLVGDSLGMTALGHPDTTSVTLEMMIHHTAAVARGVQRALVVADLPFGAAAATAADAVGASVALVREGHAQAVKVEIPRTVPGGVARIVAAGIPVMGHVGLTPQAVHLFGGYSVQGRTPDSRSQILADAERAVQEGAFAVVVEAVPSDLGREITRRIPIPTIGIGAGPDCDGQILVQADLLGLFEGFRPKFVRRYADLGAAAREALRAYARDVRERRFPSAEETYA